MKGEKETNEIMGGDTCPLNLLGVTSARGGGIYITWERLSNNGHYLFETSVIRGSNQNTDSLYLKNRVPFGCLLPPYFALACAGFVPAALGTNYEGWELGSFNTAEN